MLYEYMTFCKFCIQIEDASIDEMFEHDLVDKCDRYVDLIVRESERRSVFRSEEEVLWYSGWKNINKEWRKSFALSRCLCVCVCASI